MPENGIRSNWSQCPFQILLEDNGGIISSGTGFFYDYGGACYLLTNWHIVSGKNPFNGDYIAKRHRRPTKLTAKLAQWLDPSKKYFMIKPVEIELYTNGLKNPVWFEHPTLGYKCDIVAIQYERPESIPVFMHVEANKISKIRIPVQPGCQAYVVGFPYSLSSGFGLPIWKSGFIASEPAYDVVLNGTLTDTGGLKDGIKVPAFFIDTLTRKGMSGSPVFASYTGNWDTTDPYQPLDPDAPNFWKRNDIALGEHRMEFVGIYSGRVPENEHEAALGLCWNKAAIDCVCSSRYLGANPHI